MGLKEDLIEMKKEVKQVKEQSVAMELLKDYKKANKRIFIIWIITFLALMCSLFYIGYLITDIGTYEDVITQENENGYNNYIGNDGDIINGKTDN